MSTEQVRETMEGYLDALSARGDYGRYFAEDVLFEVLWSDMRIRGAQEVEQTIRFLHEVAFDAHPEVGEVLVGERGAAAEFVFAGTHTGEFGGVAPSGNTVRVPYSVFYEVAAAKITVLRVYLPIDQLVAQARGELVGSGGAAAQ
ncbi:ester cyclase [Naasia sp. SYSU D00948]|uniref:ester cyclase n=1 Tax=Naasia sp. SYSU D00948 TaxID=2817379 RepID=UPI001B30A9E4|nr:ester cyclase [Naasia sp. SYSU D00948]